MMTTWVRDSRIDAPASDIAEKPAADAKDRRGADSPGACEWTGGPPGRLRDRGLRAGATSKSLEDPRPLEDPAGSSRKFEAPDFKLSLESWNPGLSHPQNAPTFKSLRPDNLDPFFQKATANPRDQEPWVRKLGISFTWNEYAWLDTPNLLIIALRIGLRTTNQSQGTVRIGCLQCMQGIRRSPALRSCIRHTCACDTGKQTCEPMTISN